VWTGRLLPDISKAFITSSISASLSAAFAAFLFYTTSVLYPVSADASTAPAYQALMAMERADREEKSAKRPPKIDSVSTEKALSLSKRIQALDGKMYGAYWCSHCNNQKKAFGYEAFSRIPYIECDKEGASSQNDLCKLKKVPGYPTWELNGVLFPGEKSLDEIEALVEKLEKISISSKYQNQMLSKASLDMME
jgi:hypothetical protein